MNRITRYVAISCLALIARSATGEAVDYAVARSVAQIRGLDGQGKLYFGSGVIIGRGLVATNCHVVRSGGRIGVFRGAESFRVARVRADTFRDLCLLDTPGLETAQARMGRSAALKPGKPLYFYGYPRALGMSMSAGEVKRLHPFDGSRIIETSAFFTLGGSGGGLFDSQGRLVGLATFLAPGHQGAYYAIPAEWIAVVKARSSEPVQTLTGLSFWEEPVKLPAFLKAPDNHRQ